MLGSRRALGSLVRFRGPSGPPVSLGTAGGSVFLAAGRGLYELSPPPLVRELSALELSDDVVTAGSLGSGYIALTADAEFAYIGELGEVVGNFAWRARDAPTAVTGAGRKVLVCSGTECALLDLVTAGAEWSAEFDEPVVSAVSDEDGVYVLTSSAIHALTWSGRRSALYRLPSIALQVRPCGGELYVLHLHELTAYMPYGGELIPTARFRRPSDSFISLCTDCRRAYVLRVSSVYSLARDSTGWSRPVKAPLPERSFAAMQIACAKNYLVVSGITESRTELIALRRFG